MGLDVAEKMTGPTIVVVAGVACMAVALSWLLLMHLRGRIDLVDVVTEAQPDGRRRASLRKTGEAVALGASTFVVVYDAIDQTGANDLVLGLYLAAWVSRTLLGMLAQSKAGAISAASGGAK